MEEFKCPVCKTQYTQLNPPRLLTMCGHTFCHLCIKTFIKRKYYRYQIRCPEDKLRLNLDSPTPSQFPKNMIVVQAISKIKPKVQASEQRNQFLMGVFTQNLNPNHKHSNRFSVKQTILAKRSSIDDGRCLLHQKPLDIICLYEKAHICAECALFGIHKGHVCTTIKDLQQKRIQWIQQIAQIIQQRKHLQQKMNSKIITESLNSKLQKKKQSLFDQTKDYFQKLKQILCFQQERLKKSIEQSISVIEKELTKNVYVSQTKEEIFQNWQKQVLESMQFIQTDDIQKQIIFFSNMILFKDQNLVSKGRNIIQQLKKQQDNYWNRILKSLQLPKLKFEQNFQQHIKDMAELIFTNESEKTPQKRKNSIFLEFDSTSIHGYGYVTPQFQQVSLLDFTDNFKGKFNISTINDSHNETKILTDNSFLPNLESSSQLTISPKTIKKAKSKDSLINSSLYKLNDKRDSIGSPKYRKKTEFLSKATLPSPSALFSKNKNKRNLLKVKDPQKFQKIIKALQTDNLQIVDFTGFEMGDENAKQVFQKLKSCKKVKSLRLMKNQLTDQILKQLLEVFSELQIINLSQNAFTSKIFEVLQIQARKYQSNKIKYIQLGQNNINPRKYRQKLQDLKNLGYIVSL